MEPIVVERKAEEAEQAKGEESEAVAEALAAEEAHGPDGLLATYFEIPGDEFPALAAREAEFALTPVVAFADNASCAPMCGGEPPLPTPSRIRPPPPRVDCCGFQPAALTEAHARRYSIHATVRAATGL